MFDSAKFEYYSVKTVGVAEYTTQAPPKNLKEKCLSSENPKIKANIIVKCAQHRRFICSICEHTLCEV